MRRVLRDIGGGAAIFAAEGEALQEAHGDQDDRRRDADLVVAGKQADDEGRQAHDQDGDEEGVFAADEIAEPAEDQRAERADQEAGGEGEQREDVGRRLRELAEELRADDGREGAVEIEIIPFEDRAQRRGEDHLLLAGRHRPHGILARARN